MIDLESSSPSHIIVEFGHEELGGAGTASIRLYCAGPLQLSAKYSEGVFRQLLHTICDWAASNFGGVLSLVQYRDPLDLYWIERYFGVARQECVLGARFMGKPGEFPSMVGSDANPLQLLCSSSLSFQALHRQTAVCGANPVGELTRLRSLLWSGESLSVEGIDFYCETPDSERWFQLFCQSSKVQLIDLLSYIRVAMPYISIIEAP
jgi:hypothetical protein